MPGPRSLTLPSLPQRLDGSHWPSSVYTAYDLLEEAYNRANQLLRLEDGDAIRLQCHSDHLCFRILPLLQELSKELEANAWSTQCIQDFGSLIDELDNASKTINAAYVASSWILVFIVTFWIDIKVPYTNRPLFRLSEQGDVDALPRLLIREF